MAKLSAGYIHMYLLRILIGPSVFPALTSVYMYLLRILIECFHSRGQHICKFIGTKESVCIRKEFNSRRDGLGHQHGRRDVMWKHSIGPLGFPSLSTGYMYHYLWLDFKMNLLEKVFDLVSASDRLYHIPMLCRLKICFFLVRCQLFPLSSFASQTETPSSFEVFLFLHLVCKLSGKINKTYFSSIYNFHLSFHPFSSSFIRSCDYAI